ncbi:MAG: DUF4391 domain-containing protein [Arachnia sp.]
MSEPVLFHWPLNASFGRTVPKAKIYQHGNVRTTLRERFVEEVQRVTWAYKLAEDTIRLRGTAAVPEIQVFAVEAKGADVSDGVLAAIDKTVHFPVIFEVGGSDRVRTVAAQKTLGKTPTIGTYFTTAWQPADAPRRTLPTVLDLPSLYEAILASLLPVPSRVGETVRQVADRLDRAAKLRREIAALERKLRNEPQLNRKIDLRRQLKELDFGLAELTDPAPSTGG